MSPVSVIFALGMTTAGTTDESKTQNELRQFLRYPELGSDEGNVHKTLSSVISELRSTDNKVELIVANSIWVEGGVADAFRDSCASAFASQVRPLGSAAAVNEWVEGETRGLIQRLLSKDPPGPAVIINAVYFKAAWASAFVKDQTVPAQFRRLDGTEVSCMLMSKNDKKTLLAETDHAQVVFLPYGGGDRFFAAVILPTVEGQEGLDAAAESVLSRLDQVFESAGKSHVVLSLPRFKIEYGPFSLKPALSALGVSEAFRPAAGFLRMGSDPQVYVEDVLHKAVIEVNEEGTVAAAATAVVMTRALRMPVTVRADRPFYFAVLDANTTGAGVLFAAKVADPS